MTPTSSVLTLWVPIGLIVTYSVVVVATYIRGERRIKRQRAILDQRIADAARMKGDA